MLSEKTDGGQSARDVLLPILQAHGVRYDVVGADLNQTDFTAQIERFKPHAPAYDLFVTIHSEAGKYLLTEVPGLPKAKWNSTTKAFVASFTRRFNSPPTPQAIESYDAEYVIADAIKRAGSTDPKAVIAALEKTSVVLGRGKYSFATDHAPDWHYHQFVDAPVNLIQFDTVGQTPDDAPVVWPRSLATVPYVYNRPPR